jgi:hypothetical protein
LGEVLFGDEGVGETGGVVIGMVENV